MARTIPQLLFFALALVLPFVALVLTAPLAQTTNLRMNALAVASIYAFGSGLGFYCLTRALAAKRSLLAILYFPTIIGAMFYFALVYAGWRGEFL
jgi:hypothetical protein